MIVRAFQYRSVSKVRGCHAQPVRVYIMPGVYVLAVRVAETGLRKLGFKQAGCRYGVPKNRCHWNIIFSRIVYTKAYESSACLIPHSRLCDYWVEPTPRDGRTGRKPIALPV
jgi:hypothetical protein